MPVDCVYCKRAFSKEIDLRQHFFCREFLGSSACFKIVGISKDDIPVESALGEYAQYNTPFEESRETSSRALLSVQITSPQAPDIENPQEYSFEQVPRSCVLV